MWNTENLESWILALALTNLHTLNKSCKLSVLQFSPIYNEES